MSTFKELKGVHRKLRGNVSESFGIRIHRALSWLDKSEQEKDLDSKFVFLWISLNSAYAVPLDYAKKVHTQNYLPSSDEAFRSDFFRKMLKHNNKEIHQVIWETFSGPIRGILNNKFILKSYWQYKEEDWDKKLHKEKMKVHRAISDEKDTHYILGILFKRLYVLRNQIIHGGSTWKGKINRDQVNDGARLMQHIVPLFIDIMMKNPSEDWGPLTYSPPLTEQEKHSFSKGQE
jgi:hypothetical protein